VVPGRAGRFPQSPRQERENTPSPAGGIVEAMRIHLLSAGIALVLSPFAIAQEPGAAKQPFTIGSDAPKPVIEKFVRGTEPAWNQPGKTYVVEFWATWCGPCRASMPHISELQEKYGDKLVVVGISDEKVEKVTSFLDTD
jgi:thiol-disulfide isomerase/thioredoxin